MKTAKFTVSALAIVAASAVAAQARDQVQVAGSSTVLPYSTIVAEVFGENTDFPTPVIESGGTGAGALRRRPRIHGHLCIQHIVPVRATDQGCGHARV